MSPVVIWVSNCTADAPPNFASHTSLPEAVSTRTVKYLLLSPVLSNLRTTKSAASSRRSVKATLSEFARSEHSPAMSSEADEVKSFPAYRQSG